jgi:nucleotide-binding universal stress UspA family protein
MKTILVPTDFSDAASNAVDYAAEIAKLTQAKLILFHVYHLPVVPAEVPVVMPIDEIKSDSIKGLKKIERRLYIKHGEQMIIESEARLGFPIEEINLFAKECKADLIVMGMEGVGYLTEKIIGSITTSLIKKAQCPVLAISKNVRFTSLKKIVLACDYEQIDNKSILSPLKEIAKLFKSHLYLLNVVPATNELPTISKAVEGMKLDHTLEDINHSFHYVQDADIIEGINDFVEEKAIDMVAMIPRKHSWWQNLLQEPTSKRMAFHAKTALLTLHE